MVSADRLAEIGLGHQDAQTRRAVLSSGLPLPAPALVDHALHDQDPQARAEALLQLLVRNLGTEELARETLNDPDSSVQALAQEMLARQRGELDMLAGDDPGMGEILDR
jgi:hypothetical protein